MADYDIFSQFYDQALGSRDNDIKNIISLIDKYNPNSQTVLDLACGSGIVLKALGSKYKKFGIDLSPKMLKLAKAKISNATFLNQNISNYHINHKFDLILCNFDSINHLLTFSEWEKCFKHTYQHLNKNGVFIFDINTVSKLEEISLLPIIKKPFRKNELHIKVNKNKNIYTWNIKVLEHLESNKKIHNEDIPETSFPLEKIKTSLLKIYKEVILIDFDTPYISEDSKRIYFICKI